MQINLMPDLSLLAVMAIFWVNYLVVKRFFLVPINRVIEEREHEAKSAEKVYEESLARFNEETAKMEEQLHVAKREAGSVRDRYRAEAAGYRTDVVNRTSTDAKSMVAEAASTLERAVKEARDKIVRESESLARLAAERILGRAV
jgi:F0F1-type ATP synthase membrane subunit b/b'